MNKDTKKDKGSNEQINELTYSYKIMQFMGELVAGADHEIKNLSMIIEGSAQIIADSRTTTHQKQGAIDVIQSKVKRIGDTISDLRTVLKDGSMEKTKQHKLKELMQKAITLCSKRFTNHRIIFKINISEELTVVGKETQLIQAILGVLTSAHDSIMNHTERWIHVYVNENVNDVSVAVEDSGDQLTERDKVNLTDFMYSTEDGRTGIGIAMAKNIIEGHLGKVIVKNKEGHPHIELVLPKGQPTANQGVMPKPSEVEEIEVYDSNIVSINKPRKVA